MNDWDFLKKANEIWKGEFNPEKQFKELDEIDEIKALRAYNNSAENLKNCEPFEQMNQKFILLQNQYGNSFNELYKDIDKKICRREYAKGGLGFHRGYYSPSMMDLVVGGVNRGRLLKRLPKNNNYNYEYLFDAQDNLICVHDYGINSTHKPVSTELFVYQEDKVLSLEFYYYENISLHFISECQYENKRLIRYESARCNLFYGGSGCTEINVETYEYTNDLLQSFCWYRYNPSMRTLTQEKFIFNRDEEGYLSTYVTKQLGGFKPKTKFESGEDIYNVRVKRKR